MSHPTTTNFLETMYEEIQEKYAKMSRHELYRYEPQNVIEAELKEDELGCRLASCDYCFDEDDDCGVCEDDKNHL